MEDAVRKFITDAFALFDANEAPASALKIRSAIANWNKFDRLVKTTLSGILKVCTDICDHRGAQTGCNERDGSWMNPCPKCGHSY